MLGICRAALHACIALAHHSGKDTPGLTADETIARADGVALVIDLAGDAFTALRDS
jgi:hypothetical protein